MQTRGGKNNATKPFTNSQTALTLRIFHCDNKSGAIEKIFIILDYVRMVQDLQNQPIYRYNIDSIETKYALQNIRNANPVPGMREICRPIVNGIKTPILIHSYGWTH